MKTRAIYLFFISLLLTFTGLPGCQSVESDRLYQQVSPYSFAETLMFLDVAISEHNYRVIHRSEIGQAIRDRGDKDFPLSTIINFCNISHAHEMILINPDLLNDMPCHIVVRQQGDQVIVSTKLMETVVNNAKQRHFAKKINQILINIIQSTIE